MAKLNRHNIKIVRHTVNKRQYKVRVWIWYEGNLVLLNLTNTDKSWAYEFSEYFLN